MRGYKLYFLAVALLLFAYGVYFKEMTFPTFFVIVAGVIFVMCQLQDAQEQIQKEL